MRTSGSSSSRPQPTPAGRGRSAFWRLTLMIATTSSAIVFVMREPPTSDDDQVFFDTKNLPVDMNEEPDQPMSPASYLQKKRHVTSMYLQRVSKHLENPRNLMEEECKKSTSRDFKAIGKRSQTHKVEGNFLLPSCLEKNLACAQKEAGNEICRVMGSFYDSIYNRWLKDYSTDEADPFQFVEIGYFNGRGFDAFTEFLPNAELHAIEICCIEEGPRSEGKWPWGNFAKENKNYEDLLRNERMHCGDASDYNFLHETWSSKLRRTDAPPLKVVVDDGSYLSEHMAASLFFWIPRIEPGGMLIIEGIKPLPASNMFRTRIIPQVMKDIHWCGLPTDSPRCFPTLQPFIAGVDCESHICVFHRNNVTSIDPDKASSTVPLNAYANAAKCLFGE